MNNLEVLLVDDDDEYGELLKFEAEEHNIELHLETNLEDMKKFLSTNKSRIGGIILDIKCLKSSNQPIESESFLAAALDFLNMNEDLRYIPRAILTGDKEGYKIVEKFYPDERLFEKVTGDTNKLFVYLTQQAKKVETIKLRKSYEDIFRIFKKSYLPAETENALLILLKNIKNDNITEIRKNLALIRTIQEKIFQIINEKDKNLIPDNCFNQRNIRFNDIHRHLKSRDIYYYTNVIEYFSQSIYRISSDQGSHSPDETDYRATKYTVQSLTYALMDFLKWFEARMDKIKTT